MTKLIVAFRNFAKDTKLVIRNCTKGTMPAFEQSNFSVQSTDRQNPDKYHVESATPPAHECTNVFMAVAMFRDTVETRVV